MVLILFEILIRAIEVEYNFIIEQHRCKMINALIKMRIVKQINEKQRYRVYGYVSLMEWIKKI